MSVAVIAGGGFQGQGLLDAIHAIDGVRAIVIDSTQDAIGELHADAYVRCPSLNQGRAFERFLVDQVAAEGIELVIPATQRELRRLSNMADALLQAGARTAVCPPDLLEIVLDKAMLYAELAAVGLDVQSPVELTVTARYPLFGRPREGWGGRDNLVVRAADDLAPADRDRLARSHLWTPLIEHFEELSADFAIDFEGRISTVTLRQRVRTSGGFSVVSQTVSDAPARHLVDELAKWLSQRSARGLFNVQVLRKPDGRYLISDLNPRHGTSSGHALAEGNNLVAFLLGRHEDRALRSVRTVRSLTQQPIPVLEKGTIQGVVLDLDGTLLDQQRWMLDRMERAALTLAGDVDPAALMLQAYCALEQGEHARLIDVVCERLERKDLHDRLLAAYRKARPAHAHVFPEVLDVLRNLRQHGIALAMLTDNPPQAQRAKLAAAGALADAFDALVFAREHGAEKPAGSAFEAAARSLSVAPQHLMMVGDNPARDALGAIRAGFHSCLLLRRSGGRYQARPDLLRRCAPDVAKSIWIADDLRVLPLALRLAGTGASGS